MNKQIMYSIHSEWLIKILNGEKKYEFRNKLPKDIKKGMIINLYCTKAKNKYRIDEHLIYYSDELYRLPNGKIKFGSSVELMAYENYDKNNFLNSKVVASFVVNSIAEIKKPKDIGVNWRNQGYSDQRYAIEITNLKIFDEPRELGSYVSVKKAKVCPTYNDGGAPFAGRNGKWRCNLCGYDEIELTKLFTNQTCIKCGHTINWSGKTGTYNDEMITHSPQSFMYCYDSEEE